LFDSADDAGIAGEHVGGKAGDDGAVTAYDKLFEVPEDGGQRCGLGEALGLEVAGDIAAEACVVDDMLGCGRGEFGVERVLVRPGDDDLGEHGEGDGIVGRAELGDLLVGAGFLACEVVGGEAEDDEPLVLELLIEGFEISVLGGESAARGDVDDQQGLAGEVGEGGGGAGEGREREVVESRHEDSLASFARKTIGKESRRIAGQQFPTFRLIFCCNLMFRSSLC